jgi:hypothetical protein
VTCPAPIIPFEDARALVRLRCVNPLAEPDWDRWIQTHPRATIFHTAAWARVLRDTYEYEPCYLASGEPARLLGLLPLMDVRSPWTGRRGVALPFTDECEPLTSPEVPLRSIYDEVLQLGIARGWRYFELRGSENPVPEAQPSLKFYGHVLSLASSPEKLWDGFDGSLRTAIRKAESSDVKIQCLNTLDGIREYYRLHCLTRKKHGLPPQPFAFFDNIQRHILAPGLGFLAMATHQQQPIAADVFFRFGTKAVYKFGASDDAHQQLRGSNLVMWEAIRNLVRLGCTGLDFGRTSVGNEGLRRFKLNWGAKERTIHYFKCDPRSKGFLADLDKASGWHTAVFRLMPLRLSGAIGKLLYRHMA